MRLQAYRSPASYEGLLAATPWAAGGWSLIMLCGSLIWLVEVHSWWVVTVSSDDFPDCSAHQTRLIKSWILQHWVAEVGSTGTHRAWIEPRVWPQGTVDLFRSCGSSFSHRIPTALSSGKRSPIYIMRETPMLSNISLPLYVSQFDPQPFCCQAKSK